MGKEANLVDIGVAWSTLDTLLETGSCRLPIAPPPLQQPILQPSTLIVRILHRCVLKQRGRFLDTT